MAAARPLVLISGAVSTIAALTFHYHLSRGSRYRDLVLISGTGTAIALGHFILGLDGLYRGL